MADASQPGIDLLAFGPHPDDLDIGMAGTIARHCRSGARVGLCDLTAGEMGSNGTVDERRREALAAAAVLGAAWREPLGWPDGAIEPSAPLVRSAVEFIRRHRPRTIAAQYWDDRHPDHRGASEALTQAAFKAALRRYDTGQPPWRPDWICYYFINNSATPSFRRLIESRDAQFGAQIGVQFAEGFVVRELLARGSLLK